VNNAKTVKHDDKCEACDEPSSRPEEKDSPASAPLLDVENSSSAGGIDSILTFVTASTPDEFRSKQNMDKVRQQAMASYLNGNREQPRSLPIPRHKEGVMAMRDRDFEAWKHDSSVIRSLTEHNLRGPSSQVSSPEHYGNKFHALNSAEHDRVPQERLLQNLDFPAVPWNALDSSECKSTHCLMFITVWPVLMSADLNFGLQLIGSSSRPTAQNFESGHKLTGVSSLSIVDAPAERRRIQNRIAQRNYRAKLRERLADLQRRAQTDLPPSADIMVDTADNFVDPEVMAYQSPDESMAIQCVCGNTNDHRFTIPCITCGTWQHITCYRYYDLAEDLVESHACYNCSPRVVTNGGSKRRFGGGWAPNTATSGPESVKRAKTSGAESSVIIKTESDLYSHGEAPSIFSIPEKNTMQEPKYPHVPLTGSQVPKREDAQTSPHHSVISEPSIHRGPQKRSLSDCSDASAKCSGAWKLTKLEDPMESTREPHRQVIKNEGLPKLEELEIHESKREEVVSNTSCGRGVTSEHEPPSKESSPCIDWKPRQTDSNFFDHESFKETDSPLSLTVFDPISGDKRSEYSGAAEEAATSVKELSSSVPLEIGTNEPEIYASYEEPLFMVFGLRAAFFRKLKERQSSRSRSPYASTRETAHSASHILEPVQTTNDEPSCSEADDVSKPDVLEDAGHFLNADWTMAQNLLPEAWKWDVEFRSGCWTCTPLEPHMPKNYPLTMAGAPLVLPVEYQWPPMGGTNPPPDPRPSTPIDCRAKLPLDVVRDLFLTFEGSIGFYLLISGLLQVIVPEGFDILWASSHMPHKYGGLQVCYIPQTKEPTMLPSTIATAETKPTVSSRSSSLSNILRQSRPPTGTSTPALKLNDFIEARILASHRKDRYSARIGLQVAKLGQPYLVMSTHVITEAILAKSQRAPFFPQRRSRFNKLDDDWNKHVEIWAGNEKLGSIDRSFDDEADIYPNGFRHDVTLVKPTKSASVREITSPIEGLGWLNRDSWNSLRQHTTPVKILGPTENHRSAKSIKCSRPSEIMVVGDGIFLNQTAAAGTSKALKDHDASTWSSLVSHALLYRVFPDFDPPNGYSGVALYAEGTREDGTQGPGIVGFQSFVQRSGYVQNFNMEGSALDRRLQLGRVAFYGAFEVPEELKREYTIV
jgi:hypothetical protein